ncbi:MAG: 2-oxo acid dehydrogenase subunit E2 [Chloroflexota bacterium]|nr:MAG: 2-oxo acid dehydrogenase subunit E2 [Chloroflexota bacterium]
MATEVIMPSLGESVFEGTIATWLKREGDQVEQYEPILEIETDKVTTEATAEVAGTLLKILVGEGSTVEVGTVLAYIGRPGDEIGAVPEEDAAPASKEPAVTPDAEPAMVASPGPARLVSNGPSDGSAARPYSGRISPVVGRIAAEHDVDLNQVTGTGRHGRITKKDILAFVEQEGQMAAPASDKLQERQTALAAPVVAEVTQRLAEPAATPAVPGEVLALSSMRRAIAEHMVRSKHTSPHVTTVFEVDFGAVAAHRAANKARFAQGGANLTFTAYVVATIVQALRAHPLVNSSWTDQGIQLHDQINIGMATAIDDGLIVPVVKQADGLSLLGLARAVNDLAGRARRNQLLPDEVQGGTFTLTNHGVSGSLFATPIINQPQCGILGMGKIEKRVKVIDDAIAIRLMAYASLTFDHRILDGATADYFMSSFKETIETWS